VNKSLQAKYIYHKKDNKPLFIKEPIYINMASTSFHYVLHDVIFLRCVAWCYLWDYWPWS